MIVFSKTLSKHLKHLRTLFQLFRERRVSLSSKKSFLEYPSMMLLDKRVDFLGLTTSKKKLATITALSFSTILRDLKIFLNLIE